MLLYADDCVVFAESHDEMQRALVVLGQVLQEIIFINKVYWFLAYLIMIIKFCIVFVQ